MTLANLGFSPLVLSAFACAAITLGSCQKNAPPTHCGFATATGEAQIGGPFSLINQDGAAVTEQDFLGRPMLIYFGFTFCPDICPTSLLQMGQVLSESDPDGKLFQPVFISVDPERDRPENLALYVTNGGFPKGLTGLTGSEQQIEQVKQAYKMYAAKVDDPSSQAGYTVDHLSMMYLMGPDGKFVDVYSHNTPAADIAACLTAYKKTL